MNLALVCCVPLMLANVVQDVEPTAPDERAPVPVYIQPPAVAPAPTAAPTPPNAEIPRAAPTPAAESSPPVETKQAAAPVPWKLLSKVGSGVAYGAWLVMWGVSAGLGTLGLVVWGLSTSPALESTAAGFVAGGFVLSGLGLLALTVGALALAAGVGLAITTTVLQTLDPDNQAADSFLSAFIPRTLLL